jgi:hypothetical protein
MTTTLTIRCDRCGGVIPAGRTLLRAECGPFRETRPEIDLCPPCAAELVNWLGSAEAPTATEIDPDRSPEATNRR